MNRLLALILMTVIAVPALAADAAKPAAPVPTSKADLAKAVAAVMPLDQQISDFSDSIAQQLPEEKRALFKSIMKKNIDIDVLRSAATDSLQKTYNDAELKAMYEFYSKPEAKEIMRKLGTFGDNMQPVVEGMVRKAVEEAQKAGVLTP